MRNIFMFKDKRVDKSGFSITELILTLCIIILLGFGLMTVSVNQIKKTKVDNFKQQMQRTSNYIEGCLTDSGMLLNSKNTDMLDSKRGGDGGSICSVPGYGKYAVPRERIECDGDGIYGVYVTSDLEGLEAVCSLNRSKDEKCAAVCSSQGCVFTGKCN